MTERRIKRTTILEDGTKITTIRTYRKHKQFLKDKKINISYNKKTKKYFQIEKEIEFKKIKREPEKELEIKTVSGLKIRKQVVINFRPSFNDPSDSIGGVGAISIRAITINPEIDERGLKIVAIEVMEGLEDEYNLRAFEKKYLGYEEVLIPSSEDNRLNDYKVHIEVQVNKNKPMNFIR